MLQRDITAVSAKPPLRALAVVLDKTDSTRSRRSAESATSAAQPASSPTFSGERSYRASVARSTRASNELSD